MVPDGEVPGPDPHHVVKAELHDQTALRVHLDKTKVVRKTFNRENYKKPKSSRTKEILDGKKWLSY